MISLIVCSRAPRLSSMLLENIQTTIGAPYELIVIDNTHNRYNIFEAYNIGVSRSKYSILCFMHDDILFHSSNWGWQVISHFEENTAGIIGIAGSPYYPKVPGSWWGGGLVNETLVHDVNGSMQILHKCVPGSSPTKQQVVAIDGVWMCVRKSLFEHIAFDELNYKGFHFYDMDICMQVHKLGYKIWTVSDISIRHFYSGKVNKVWISNLSSFRKKWKRELPAEVSGLSDKEKADAEFKALKEYIRIVRANGTKKIKANFIGISILLRFCRFPQLRSVIFKRNR